MELLDAVSSIADFHETFHQRDGLDADGDPCAVVLVLRADTNGGDHFVVDDAERGGLIRQGVAAFVDAQGNHQIRLLAADVKFEKLHEGQQLAVCRAGVFFFDFSPLFEHGTDFSVSGHGCLLLRMRFAE